MKNAPLFVTKSDVAISKADNAHRILFISADYTGHGHRSISESLRQKILERSPDSEVVVVDGFALGGWLMKQFSRLYNPIVVYFPSFWGFCYRTANYLKKPINTVVKCFIRKNLNKKLAKMKPDVVVSVHAAFVTPVIDILKHKSLRIPVIVLVADLDNITDLWVDSRANKILCPSKESRDHMLRKSVPEERLIEIGFPVRAEFCTKKEFEHKSVSVSENFSETSLVKKSELLILLIYGSQGSKSIQKIIRDLLDKLPCRITIITGNNKKLKAYLEKNFKDFGNKVTVLSFTKEIKKHMQEADLLIMRASPNILMEAVNLAKPLVVIGALQGQEEKNPEYVARYGLGINCQNRDDLTEQISALLENEWEGLKRIKQNQIQFRNLNASSEIAQYILSV